MLHPAGPPRPWRRAVVHNTSQLPDGTWSWRYDLRASGSPAIESGYGLLWDDVAQMTMPTMLVRGSRSAFVTAADLDRVVGSLPTIRVEVVQDAGHAVQSDQPRALRALIRDFVPY